jgi:hypothetical protein
MLPACSIHFGDWGEPAVWIEATESFSVDAGSLQGLSCKTHNGRIESTGAGGLEEVKVTVRKKAGGDDDEEASEAMDSIRIINETENGQLRLGWEWLEPRDSDWRAQVSFEIEQPARLATSAESHNGRIIIDGIEESCRAETHNGRIQVSAASHMVMLETHNGGIVAELSAAGGVEGRIVTHNGAVRVDLHEDASTELRCSTHNGSISSNLPLSDRFQGRNFLSGNLGEGGGRLTIETHNGSIKVR